MRPPAACRPGKVSYKPPSGFIGSHVARQLLRRGDTVLGLDNFNDYYVVRIISG